RHGQGDGAGLGLELAGIVARPGIDAVGGALVPLGPAQGVGLGVEQSVERLLDRFPNDLIYVALYLALLDADDFAEAVHRRRHAYTVHRSLPWLVRGSGFATLSLPARRLPINLCATIPTLSMLTSARPPPTATSRHGRLRPKGARRGRW